MTIHAQLQHTYYKQVMLIFHKKQEALCTIRAQFKPINNQYITTITKPNQTS